ncbi:carboxylesterase family protein [Sunxiuqinia indica]|uniref:carboxylesterase family protein n=1 Tax=Sunxiuqinia indica TaxID=2692584 RepID=UPI00135B5CBA|nr:PHB depolymerase family esterase [Sunxiuqinia indica]
MNISKLQTLFLLLISLNFSFRTLIAQNSAVKANYNYLTYLPENYDSLNHKLFPVIFYLHGRSVSGTDIQQIKTYGLPYFLDKGKKLDFIVVAPQCPWGKNWASDNWFDTVYAEINAKYRIDSSRIYLTGMSLGGFGTWELANRYPNRFAAIAPLCGGGKDEWAENLSHIPIWVFHGAQDKLVPVLRSDRMVKALQAYDSPISYNRFPDKGHNLHRIYNDDRLYEWFSHFTLRPKKTEGDQLHEIDRIHLAELNSTKPQTDELKKHQIFQYKTF